MYLRTLALLGVLALAPSLGEAGILKQLNSQLRGGGKDRQTHSSSPVAGSEAATAADKAYGSDPLQKLDIYAPKGNAQSSLPVLIFVHGGAWAIGDKRNHDDKAALYTANGILFVSINYRLHPNARHPAQAEDVAAAVRWVYDHISQYGGDNNRIYISGHSAGAHLAALVGTDGRHLAKYGLSPQMLRAVIADDSASYDFTQPARRSNDVQRAIDETFGTDMASLAAGSPLSYVRGNTALPPFLLFVAERREEAVAQTTQFFQALQAAGASSEMIPVPGLSHEQMGDAMADADSVIAQKILAVIGR